MLTSIVIATYNKLEYTMQCIQSIRDFTEPGSYELIVVDNHSTDGTVEWLHQQSDVLAICNEENLGFPKACNQGIEVAKGDDILLLNNDTVVTERWLSQLAQCLYSSEDIGAVGCVTNNCSYGQAIPIHYTSLEEMQTFAAGHNQPDPSSWEERLKLIGYCMLIKKSVIDQIGLLDERFTPGNFEDDDYSLRIRLAGYKLILCKDTFIHHYGSVSFREAPPEYLKLMQNNRQKFEDKWGFDPIAGYGFRSDWVVLLPRPQNRPYRVLEIGSGCGGNLIAVRNSHPDSELWAYEQNENAANVAKLIANVRSGEFQRSIAKFPGKYFDAILLSGSGIKWTITTEILAQLKNHLNDNGKIISFFPNSLYFKRIRSFLQGAMPSREIEGITLGEAEGLFNVLFDRINITGLTEVMIEEDKQFTSDLATLANREESKIYEVSEFLIESEVSVISSIDKVQGIKDIINAILTQQDLSENLRELTSFDPDDVLSIIVQSGPEQQREDLVNFLANQLLEYGAPEVALKYLQQVFEWNNENPNTLLNLGITMYLLNHFQLALDWFELLPVKDDKVQGWISNIKRMLPEIKGEPSGNLSSIDAWLNNIKLCATQSDKEEQREQLEHLLRGKQELLPAMDSSRLEVVEGLNTLAELAFEHEMTDEIIPLLEESLQIAPTHKTTLVNLAVVLEIFGEYKLAFQYLDRISDEDKDDEIVLMITRVQSKIVYKASIIIPVFNKVEYTKQCLEAIAKNTPEDLYEVIIVDNASTDSTREFLDCLSGDVKIIINDENVGFVGACNQGASVSTGDYLVFLNNDTVPVQGWLDQLVQVADKDNRVGIVGSMLVYPNGVLQEAGGIVWSDASGWNYGRGDDPQKPEYNFLREVDYCSGASLLVRRELFEAIGGFDSRYSPGYYEDTDLCFAVREMGYKVVYQPKSIVIHFEGITSGTDLSQGMKKYQLVNKDKFKAKWAKQLEKQYAPSPLHVYEASNRKKGKNILIVDPFLPMYDRASGSLRLFNIIKILSNSSHKVSFIARNGINQEKYKNELEFMGVEVFATDSAKMRALGYEVIGHEINLRDFMAARQYDIAWLSFYDIAEQYLNEIRVYSPKTHIIIDTVDVHYLREIRMGEVNSDDSLIEKALNTKKRELSIYSQCDTVITVTEADARLLKQELPELNIEVIPNIHEGVENVTGYNERNDLLFVGNFNHTPNIDAIQYFMSTIWPMVKQELSKIRLYIVGNNSDRVSNLLDSNVVITGYVESVLPYLQNARVSIAPLRYGAGMKGKIGEALIAGLPVVTTSIGAEGMGLQHGIHAMIHDDPVDFAKAVVELYRSESAWNSLSSNGAALVNERYSYQALSNRVTDLLDHLGSNAVREEV